MLAATQLPEHFSSIALDEKLFVAGIVAVVRKSTPVVADPGPRPVPTA
jgi:hypothetical protein